MAVTPSRHRSPDPSRVGFPLFSRRDLLRGAAGAAGLAAVGGLLNACGSSGGGGAATTTASGGTAAAAGGDFSKATGTVTLGSNYSDAVPKQALADALAGFKAASGADLKVNTVTHNDFQENINNYLQGTPDDVWSWFAGYRMQFFAAQGLATEFSDVWSTFTGFSDALKAASTGADGKQYFVPFYYYPWAVFYRKSVFQDKGYETPKTFDEFTALADKIKKDGMTPIAFADKDGWPAMGTFDYLNMRLNGYDFHIDLMAHKEAWTDAKVKNVFDTWKKLLPYYQEGALGRTWEEGAQSVVKKESAMYVLGMFVGQQFTEQADKDDLDFFAFPELDSAHGQDSVEAPIDGFMLSKSPKNPEGAKALISYIAQPTTELAYLKSDPNNIAASSEADTSGYNALQKKAVELIGSAQHISQFLDRDTRPDFASTVMIPSLQSFINNPNDIDGLTKSIEDQAKSIFAG
jgi:multiple sugar transport system substrate-binding protein